MAIPFSKLSDDSLHYLAETTFGKNVPQKKKKLITCLTDATDNAGVRELAFMLKGLELDDVCNRYLQVEHKEGANTKSKMVLTKRLVESFEESGIENWFKSCEDKDVLLTFCDALGLETQPKSSMALIKESAIKQIRVYGAQVLLSRLSVQQLKTCCEDMELNGWETSTSKKALITAILTQSDVVKGPAPVKKAKPARKPLEDCTDLEEIQKYTIKQLEAYCVTNELTKTGSKKVLAARVYAHITGDKENLPEEDQAKKPAKGKAAKETKQKPTKKGKAKNSKKTKKPEPEPEPESEASEEEDQADNSADDMSVEEESAPAKTKATKAPRKAKLPTKPTKKTKDPEPVSEVESEEEQVDEEPEETPESPKKPKATKARGNPKSQQKPPAKKTKQPEPEPEPEDPSESEESPNGDEENEDNSNSYDAEAEQRAIDAERELRTTEADPEESETPAEDEIAISESEPTEDPKKPHSLANLTVALMGNFEGKSDLAQAIKDAGGNVSLKLTKTCEYVYCPNPKNRKKIEEALTSKKSSCQLVDIDFFDNIMS